MNKQEKLQLLEELVKEGRITLCQAFELSEPEKEKEYVPYFTPHQDPYKWEPFKWTEPGTIRYGTRTNFTAGSTNTQAQEWKDLETKFNQAIETGAIEYKTK